MPTLPKFTPEHRRHLFLTGANSLFFFAQAILGMPDLEEHPHLELCENLVGRGTWGDWRRGLICASRGFLKSSIASVAFPAHQGIYKVNHATRLLGSGERNVKTNFFDKIHDIFMSSGRRGFLEWLYSDCVCTYDLKGKQKPADPECPYCGGMGHRLPDGFANWTESSIVFPKSDPMALDALTYKGIAADQEGAHVNLVIFDDPEGADAEKSEVSNEDAWRAWNHAVPLLVDPSRDRILAVLTPHGAEPLAYRLLEGNNHTVEWDNAKRSVKVWWMPLVNEEGESNWPQRFTPAVVELIRNTTTPEVYEKQYLLKKRAAGGGYFDPAVVERNHYRWLIPGKCLEYEATKMDVSLWEQKGELKLSQETRKAWLKELRYFIHVDPKHREDTVSNPHGNARPSRAAMVIVGMAADGHVFVLGTWTADADINKQVEQLYRFYRTYGAYQVTFDPIGAQVWFKEFASNQERHNRMYQRLETTGVYTVKRQLPALTSRLVEDKRSSRENKEDVIASRLLPWFQDGLLHLHPSQDELLHQIRGFPAGTVYVDLVDALAQGPPVWFAPGASSADDLRRQNQNLLRLIADKHTGAFSPWQTPQLPTRERLLLPPGDENWQV